MNKIWKLGVRIILALGCTGLLLFAAGCGDDNNNARTQTTSTGSLAAPAGTVAAGATVSPPAGVTSLTFAAASSLTDSLGAPVTGTITTTVTRSTSVSDLPVAAQTPPAGTSLAVFLNIDMSQGATKVKNFTTPMTAIVAVPTGITIVDVYSFNGTSWVLEQAGVAVAGGNATFNITHLSIWGCFSPITITTTSPLPAGTVNAAYNQALAATGGTAPYSWKLAVGNTLPANLTLSTAGVISGTPTVAGTSSANITVTDAAAGTVTKAFSITVNPAGAVLSITTASPLAAGTVGTAYAPVTLNATGGTSPYTWTVPPGTLPAGLSLSTTGIISGIPTAAGTANFTVTATDSASPTKATATKLLSITVNATGPAVPAAPTGVVATGGTNSVSISWPAVTGATSYNIYWSAVTGVTTASTKITGATSPTIHSRLTATPTWLAANTPYFYIVTAVNAAGESAPSSPQSTATTSATDGVALYAANCAGCHFALASPNQQHVGASTALIQTGITNVTQMNSLSTLTVTQISAIADVMAAGF